MTRQQLSIGRHHIEIEGDVIHSRWLGVCSLRELEEFLAFLDPILVRERYPFLIIDNTHAAPGLPEVRRRLFEWSRTHRIAGGVVIFGATAATRVIGMLILRGIALWKGAEFMRRMIIVPDEPAALDWIARRRTTLDAEATSADGPSA